MMACQSGSRRGLWKLFHPDIFVGAGVKDLFFVGSGEFTTGESGVAAIVDGQSGSCG